MDSYFQNKPIKKKLKLLDDDQEQENPSDLIHVFQKLPRDVLLDVLTRLPVSSLIQFRFVCKSCHLLSRDPELPQLHHSAAATTNPTLMFHCDYPIRNQLHFVELSSSDDNDGGGGGGGNVVRKISTPFSGSMPEFNIIGSCNGLLCLSDSLYGEPVYVFNPFTREYLELPKSQQFQEQEVMFGFGFHRITNQYKVVRIVYYRNPCNGHRIIRNYRNYPKSEVQVLTIGSNNTWRFLGKMPHQLDRQAKEVVVVHGRIHWLSRPGRVSGRTIVSFDIKDEQFKVVSKPSHATFNRSNYHLAVIRGCLSAVVSCGYGRLEIWVMKEYDVNGSWTKEFDIHGAYLARTPSQEHDYGVWRKAVSRRAVRVVCVLSKGEVLMEYRGGSLVKYDPKWKEFKDVVFHGMPKLFQTFVHVGSLNWIGNTSI